ncbi:MAG: S-layer homology domain-containing protein [Firmicutes bacterium]|nr:S-layer homology domain-containing protein [Bacillota bacterium]
MGIVKRWTGPARGAGRRPEGENAPASRRLRLQLKALSVAMALLGARTPLVWEAHAQAGFFDVPGGAWYAELLEEAAATGRVRGYEDGSFRPDRELSFGEFLAMMTGQRTAEYSGGFEHWATGHYAYAAGQGWISEGRFPARKLPSGITRREMALIAAAAAESAGLAPDPLPRYIYTDMDSSDSAERAVSLCTALGILNGYEDGSFRPDGALRRCEALKVVMSWEKALERAAAVQVPDQGPLSGVVYGGAAEADPQAGTPGQGGAGGESAGASALGRDALGALAEAARSVRCERDGSRFSVSFEPPAAAAPGSGLEFSLRFLLYGSEEEGRDQLLWYEYGKDTPDWAADELRPEDGRITVPLKGISSLEGREFVLVTRLSREADRADGYELSFRWENGAGRLARAKGPGGADVAPPLSREDAGRMFLW